MISVIHITDCWHTGKGHVTGVVFVDLSKAFDTVDVNILLVKFTGFGIARKKNCGTRATSPEDHNPSVLMTISLTHHQ